jgi:hypothetical protein
MTETLVPKNYRAIIDQLTKENGFDEGLLGISLMSCHHIDFVALDLTFEHDRRTAIDDPLTKLLDHRLDVVSVHVEFFGDLQTRQVQSHKIEADDPRSQRLMMTREDGSSEVVKPPLTSVTEVALPIGLGVITSVFDDGFG